MKTKVKLLFTGVVVLMLLVGVTGVALAAPPLPGAIFTTDSTCTGVNINIYGDKADVYLDGGPAGGGPGLPDGNYYVQVTIPSGETVLGTSVGSGNPMPVHVTNGDFDSCYQLWAILFKASDGTTQGYDDTSNPGGEYKVWVSTFSTFDPNSSKTDNFKVKKDGGEIWEIYTVTKFYDANANGLNDDGQLITGWKVRIQDSIDYIRYTPVSIILDPDDYTVTEFYPIEPNWFGTTPNPVYITLAGGVTAVEFGNLCVGAGGGLTLGFWSNKNGKTGFGEDDLALMVSLNLRNATGGDFNPGSYAQFRTWLLSATATNMSYMLSAQLAAMELNVFNGKVTGGALIYAPGTTSANALGFATVDAVMAEANAELGLHGLVLSDSPDRAYQEALKNALDNANNNNTFVQPMPCAFTFAP